MCVALFFTLQLKLSFHVCNQCLSIVCNQCLSIFHCCKCSLFRWRHHGIIFLAWNTFACWFCKICKFALEIPTNLHNLIKSIHYKFFSIHKSIPARILYHHVGSHRQTLGQARILCLDAVMLSFVNSQMYYTSQLRSSIVHSRVHVAFFILNLKF